jgi:hypothetical protein
VIEGYIHCYWRVRQNPKQDLNRAKEWRRKWTSIAKQAGSLAASLKATGVFEDRFWTILSIRANAGTNPEDVIPLLEAISSCKVPPARSSENQDAQPPASATVPTARSVGFALAVFRVFETCGVISRNEIRKLVDIAFADYYKTVPARRADERKGSAADTDWLLTVLAEIYAMAGGRVAVSWNDPEKKIVGGPFTRFLCTIWGVLPPAGRSKTAQTFARRARDEIAKLRASANAERCRHCASIAAERGDGWWRN